MNFKGLNEEMNYYSSVSKQRGKNVWNQDSIQNSFLAMIENVNLTKEQADKIKGFMVVNNATLDMEPSVNKSALIAQESLYKNINELGKSKVA